MVQADEDWIDLAMRVAQDDSATAARYNLDARPEGAVQLDLGPVPFVGAITTAPVVLLLPHAETNDRAEPFDYAYRQPGWPLSALHPDAPVGVSDWWSAQLADLIAVFGAQHVSNGVAALFLTPWRVSRFDKRLRLPSRPNMLELATRVANRDAMMVLWPGAELWMESEAVADSPPTRMIRPQQHCGTMLAAESLGLATWDQICRQIDVHAWL